MNRGNRTTLQKPAPMLLLAALAASLAVPASATVYTWSRGVGVVPPATANNNFDNVTNWVGGLRPPQTATAPDVTDILFSGVSTIPGSCSLRQPYTVNSITFAASFVGNGTSTFSLSNSTATTGGATSVDLTVGAGGITMETTATNNQINFATTVTPAGASNRLILGADQTWTNLSPTIQTGSITLNIFRNVSGAFRVTKAGPGILILGAPTPNTEWTGGLTMVEGIVRTGGTESQHNGQFGTGSISHESALTAGITASTVSTLGGSTAGGGGNRLFDNDLVLGGTGLFTLGGSFQVNFTANSDWTLTAQKNLVISTTTNHAGTVNGNFGFNKFGGGMLVLNNANTNAGPTNVNEGVLRLTNSASLGTGSDPVSVAAVNGTTNLLGGQLELTGGITVAGKPLSIAGNGLNAATPPAGVDANRGALRSRSGANTWTGLVSLNADATVYIDDGSLNLPGGVWGTIATAGLRVSKGTAAAVALTTKSIDIQGTLTIDDGVTATISPNGTAAGASRVTSLAFGGAAALLDLNNNDLVVDYTGASPIASIIAAAQAGNLQADGDAAGLPTYLAIAEAADLGLTDYNGFTVDDTTVIAKYTYVGDANLDGQVDALDYERVDLAIGNSGVFGTAQGDLNYDGTVDALDYEQIDLNIGNGVGTPLAQAVVPEPASLSLLALSFVGLTRRRR